jgi:hypothetical protein
MGEL